MECNSSYYWFVSIPLQFGPFYEVGNHALFGFIARLWLGSNYRKINNLWESREGFLYIIPVPLHLQSNKSIISWMTYELTPLQMEQCCLPAYLLQEQVFIINKYMTWIAKWSLNQFNLFYICKYLYISCKAVFWKLQLNYALIHA